jgi:nicotinate-nucleotide pyrophosphorylase (carboxylating)
MRRGNKPPNLLGSKLRKLCRKLLPKLPEFDGVARLAKEFQQLEWTTSIEDDLRQIVRLAVREDLDRYHDWTTVALVDAETRGRAAIVARQAGTLAGLAALPVVIDEMHAAIEVRPRASDGDQVPVGTVVAEIVGNARDLLTCERPLLNLIGRLSGIATLTREFVNRIDGTGARIYDTRKTVPGWRRLEKYAVRCGGGHNHRTGLYDAILIKDNHLALFGGGQKGTPAEAVIAARQFLAGMEPEFVPPNMLIEVEIERVEDLEAALLAGPDIVLLDNMRPEQLASAVAIRNRIAPDIQLEASGGVSLDTVREIAQTGVDRISAGGLTHSARWLDVALDWLPSA